MHFPILQVTFPVTKKLTDVPEWAICEVALPDSTIGIRFRVNNFAFEMSDPFAAPVRREVASHCTVISILGFIVTG